MGLIYDMEVRKDVKGGSPKSPPRGIPVSESRRVRHSDRPERDPGTGYVEIRDYFTLWLERLEQFHTQRFEDLEQKTTLALAAADKANTKAETAADKRFDGVNKLREMAQDQAARFIPREEVMAKFENMADDLERLTKDIEHRRDSDYQRGIATRENKQSWIIPLIASIVIAIAALIMAILK